MKLFVIGGNGHYSKLATRHLAGNHDITIFDVNAEPCGFVCNQVAGSLMNIDELRNAASGHDAILTFFYGNAELSTLGMVNVMTVAEQCGIPHVVYTSSGGMPFPLEPYNSPNEFHSMRDYSPEFWQEFFPIREEANLFPGNETSTYFLHKWLCEEIGRHFAARGSVAFTAIRPGLLMHDDMTNRPGGETDRNYVPFFMLMTGHIRVCDLARMYDLALRNPPNGSAVYHASNDTVFNNLSIEKAQKQLGFQCLDSQIYLDFYRGDRMNWQAAAKELIAKGFPEPVIRSLYAFSGRDAHPLRPSGPAAGEDGGRNGKRNSTQETEVSFVKSPIHLTHRERVRLALEHQKTDRVPIAMVCAGINPPAHKTLTEYLRRERGITVEAYLEPLNDIRGVGPAYVGPPLPPGTDIWGVRRASVSYGAGEYNEIEFYPLADATDPADLDKHRWPTTDWFDYSVLPERIAAVEKEGDYCLMVALGSIFECSWYMRGFERMFTDLALNPELADAIFERVSVFACEHFRRILAAAKGRMDLAFTADDIGGQQGLLMSLDMWKRHIQPRHARLNRIIHEYGAKVIYHTDGSVMPAVPGLLDMGIDILQALQFDATGMDPVALKRDFGDRLCFEGGISVQRTLPFGTADDVRREVEDRIRVLGHNGGYILGPSHAIQAGTPPENIVAMFDTAARARPSP